MKYRCAFVVPIAMQLVAFTNAIEAQSSDVLSPGEFEVSSVKASRSDAREPSFEIAPVGDRLRIRNTFLGVMIMRAFQIGESQFTLPTPALIRERFDVDAKVIRPVKRSEMLVLLQKLLVERFGLRFHWDSKVMSGYALAVARGGSKLRPHTSGAVSECIHRRSPDGQLIFENCPIADLVSTNVLYAMLGRRFVADETGLAGNFDFDLMASWELPANPGEGRPEPRLINPGAPSIFTAVERQLGLKLRAKRFEVRFFTVDHVEMPSGN